IGKVWHPAECRRMTACLLRRASRLESWRRSARRFSHIRRRAEVRVRFFELRNPPERCVRRGEFRLRASLQELSSRWHVSLSEYRAGQFAPQFRDPTAIARDEDDLTREVAPSHAGARAILRSVPGHPPILRAARADKGGCPPLEWAAFRAG